MRSRSIIWELTAFFVCFTVFSTKIAMTTAWSQEPLLNCESLGNAIVRETLVSQCKALNDRIGRQREELNGLKQSLEKENERLARKCTKLGEKYWRIKINDIRDLREKDRALLLATEKKTQVLQQQKVHLQTQNEGLLKQFQKLKEENGKFRLQCDKIVSKRDLEKKKRLELARLVKEQDQKMQVLKDKVKALEEMIPSGRGIRRVMIPEDCPQCPELMRVFVDDNTKIGLPGDHTGDRRNALPQITTSLPEDFAVTRTEITVGQFMAFVNAKQNGKFSRNCIIRAGLGGGQKRRSVEVSAPSAFAALGLNAPDDISDHPAVCISKKDAQQYAAWLSEKAKGGKKYSLLSDVEWEYSARAQVEHAPLAPSYDYSMCNMMNLADLSLVRFANEETQGRHFTVTSRDIAHCWDTRALTGSVGKLGAANAYGLFDVLGNVAEMTRDCWFPGDGIDVDPGGTAIFTGDKVKCDFTAVRGGSFASSPNHATLWFKEKVRTVDKTSVPHKELGYFDVGFRLRRDL